MTDRFKFLSKAAANTDQQYETALFDLAYSKLESRLYNLLPYMVGFEVVLKDNNGAKAVGVFGFKSDNGQILFVPVFFINGKVKDLDIMYSRNNNQFYPLNEDFANLFLKDDVTGLGSVSSQTKQEVKQETNQATDYRDFIFPPRTGRIAYASVIDYLEEEDNTVKEAAMKMLADYPEFTKALSDIYPLEKIATALTPHDPEPVKEPAIRILTKQSSDIPDEYKDRVMTYGTVIQDKRAEEEKTRVGLFSYEQNFTTPTDPGFYSYLTIEGALNKGLILFPVSLNDNFRWGNALVIDLTNNSKGYYYNCDQQLFVRNNFAVNDQFKEVHKAMEDPANVQPSYDKYILINENLKCTQPFSIVTNTKDDSGLRKMTVQTGENSKYFDQYSKDKPINENVLATRNTSQTITFIFTKKAGDRLEIRGSLVAVPKGFKLMPVTDCIYSGWVGNNNDDKAREANLAKVKQNKPGNLSHLTSFLWSQGILPFEVHSNGSEYHAKAGDVTKKYEDALRAKLGFVLDFGLDEKVAEDLIKEITPKVQRGYLKFAYTGDYVPNLVDEQPQTDQLGYPIYQGVPYQQQAPIDQTYTNDPTRPGTADAVDPQLLQQNDPQRSQQNIGKSVQDAVQMAQSGQKEIFDTQAIAMMAKYIDPTKKVLNYIPSFIDTLDKLGRILFMTYWDIEKFHKMYGKDELPEMIELVKNVFKNTGDLVIFLKRKFPDISINNNDQAMDDV